MKAKTVTRIYNRHIFQMSYNVKMINLINEKGFKYAHMFMDENNEYIMIKFSKVKAGKMYKPLSFSVDGKVKSQIRNDLFGLHDNNRTMKFEYDHIKGNLYRLCERSEENMTRGRRMHDALTGSVYVSSYEFSVEKELA